MGDALDHIENVPDVVGAGVQGFDLGTREADFLRQLGHRQNGLLHHLTAIVGLLAGAAGVLRSVRRIAGDFLGRRPEFIDGRRDAIGPRALFIGTDDRGI
ncbi:hypothetical protein D3C85_509680 [compost metagenome]